MKKIILALLLILLSTGLTYAQLLNNSRDRSKVIPPPNFSPTGLNSNVITTSDGFDNFYLGTDFAEPYIAVNPTDPKNQVCAYNMNSFYYTLNGIDWIRGNPSFSGFVTTGDPVVTFDASGNVYYLQMYENGSTYGNAVAKSTNKGINWVSYTSAFSSSSNDKPWIVADQTGGPYNNYIYVATWQAGTFNMNLMRSTDHGQSYSSPIVVQGGQGAYLTIGPNGNTQGGYVYFGCLYGTSIYMYRSSDGGASYQYISHAASGINGPGILYNNRWTVKSQHIRTDIFPRMAADNSYNSTRGNIYVVYAANPVGPDLADIYLVRSTDYGVTWSQPVRVNDDATTSDQWMPAICCDKNTGKICISWNDSRNDPTGNLITEVYGTTSVDGGLTFAPNGKISNGSFNPNIMAEPQATGDAYYMGDYIGNASTGTSFVTAWMDDRNNASQTFQSFVGYFPDFALTTNPSSFYISNNDSAIVTLKVPAIRGIYTDKVKFTQSLDTLPSSGSIQFSYVNGRDSLINFPDSVYLKIKTIGNVTAQLYHLIILGSGSNGTPVHRRYVDLYVNTSNITVRTNREGIDSFKVNGVIYNSHQNFVFPNGSTISVQALGPTIYGNNKYVFKNWSDAGDTTHNVTITGPLTLTANYKVQYKLTIVSSIPFTFGGGQYFDSATTFQFGVTGRIVHYNGQQYTFHGWDGYGNGSYTSPDSTGADTVVNYSIINPIIEAPRWANTTSIQNISSEIPKEYKLYQNYPNPFNPATTINFDIIKTGNVKIAIYDALGREIKILVNEPATPGSYKVVFNAENISSGVYFYQIVTGEFTNIKKMLVIK